MDASDPHGDFFNYWGKAQGGWHLLPFHSLDVAACALVLFQQHTLVRRTLLSVTCLEPAILEKNLLWAASLHDLGKFSPGFQWKVPEVAKALGQKELIGLKSDIRHDSLGHALWRGHLEKKHNWDSTARKEARLWLQCATGHHGIPPSMAPSGKLPISLKRYFDDDALSACEAWSRFSLDFFSPILGEADYEKLKKGSWWIAGLITLADWLGSSSEWFPYEQTAKDLRCYFNASKDKARVALSESGLGYCQKRRSFSALFPRYRPTKVQSIVASLPLTDPYLLIVEEVTGSGKTEAALAAAGGTDFYFALPTLATANGLWSRVGEIGGQQTLIHGKRWLMPMAMERATSWINDSSRKALLSRIGVGTIDQAMLAVLYSRFSTLRLVGISGKTLIIDEIHAYDEYMSEILLRLVEFHAYSGGSVILLSATMSLALRTRFAYAWARGLGIDTPNFSSQDFPILSYADRNTTLQRTPESSRKISYKIRYLHQESDVFSVIEAAASKGQCTVWIRNSVKEAIAAFDALTQRGAKAELFHARFTSGDRQKIESRVLSCYGKNSTPIDRAGKILVATQVVEQSLDLDFDCMISDLAPIDLIIQRAGRLHRHDRGDRGQAQLIIYSPPLTDDPRADWIDSWSSATARVYPDHFRLWLTLKSLGDGFRLPDDTRKLIETVYPQTTWEKIRIPPGLADSFQRNEQKQNRCKSTGWDNIISLSAGGYETDGTPMWEDEKAPTRLGQLSQEWVVCEAGKPVNGSLLESLISVPVFKLKSAPEATGLKKGKWQKTLNLTEGRTIGSRENGEKFEIIYDNRCGLIL